MQAFSAGTLAGVGSFRCHSCGFAVALRERDEVPECPSCGHRRFTRASLFSTDTQPVEPALQPTTPGWLGEAREALVEEGAYLAYEDDQRVRVVPLQDGWTRIGRSLSAHLRFDDPTVSRRHALVYRDANQARILDDRSLNGVWRNGHQVDLEELNDGDQIAIGRFSLYFLEVKSPAEREQTGLSGAVG